MFKILSNLPRPEIKIPQSQTVFQIQKWISLNSTWKGQLKIVQDEISRPLGSREIQKTKVETMLWDTLYIGHICTKCSIYLTNISPIYHKNQCHSSVI